MKRFLKWAMIITGGLLVLTIAAVIIFAVFFDVHQFKPRIEKQMARATGRPVSLGDDFELSLFPRVGISFSDIQVGNPPAFKESEFIAADAFEVRVNFFPLLRGNIQISRFVLKSPRLLLITNKDQQTNWSKSTLPKKAPEPKEPEKGWDIQDIFQIKTFQADTLSIESGTLFWIDHAAQTQRKISKINLVCRHVSLDRPIDIDVACLADAYPLALKGAIGPLRKALDAKSLDVDLNLKALKQVSVHIKGRIKEIPTTPTYELALQVAPFSPRSLLAALKIKAPFLNADPKTFERLAATATAHGNPKEIHLTNGLLELDQSKLNFSVGLRNPGRPEISFDIKTDRIDLNRYRPLQKPPPKKPSKTRIDFNPLRRLSVDSRIRAKTILIGKTGFENIQLGVRCKNGRLTLKLDQMDLYGGRASGTGAMNFTKAVPAFKINGRISGIRSELASKAFLKKSPVYGPLHIKADISARGMTPADLTRSLNGTVSAKGEKITLSRFDLDDILKEYADTQSFGFLDIGSFFILGPFGPLLTRSYEQADVATAFKEGKSLIKNLNSAWKISKGVASCKDVAFSTPKNRIAVNGNVNLVKKRFDDLVVAVVDQKGCIRFSQTINGPIGKPEIIKASFVGKHIIAPFRSLFTKTKKLLSGNKCKPFYKGVVPHPVQ